MSIDIHIENLAGHPRFYEILEELAYLHSEKNADYATSEEPLQNFDRVGDWCKKYKLTTEDNEDFKVCIIYALKQLDAALKLLMHKEEGKVEGIPKRLRDVAVYSIIAEILYEESKE